MKKLLLLFFALLCLTGTAKAATAELSFDELYSGGGVLGLQFSDKVKNLAGQRITIKGFMAPPLKAEAAFFVLTREPVALCGLARQHPRRLPFLQPELRPEQYHH